MTTILLTPDDLTRNTILSGNIDKDRYLQDIKACQNVYIKPLLGATLYNKICLDFENGTLTGNYLTLYEDYVKEMVIHGAAEIYLTHGAYIVANNGITKIKNTEIVSADKVEIDFLVQSSKRLYALYEREFYIWIKTAAIPEYTKGLNYNNTVNVGGWSLHKRAKRHSRFGYGYGNGFGNGYGNGYGFGNDYYGDDERE